MLGRYDHAQDYLGMALEKLKHDCEEDANKWIHVWAELAITKQMKGNLLEAREAWWTTYEKAKPVDEKVLKPTVNETIKGDGAYTNEEFVCRATGNIGVISCLLAMKIIARVESADGAGGVNGTRWEREAQLREAKKLLQMAEACLKDWIKLALDIREGYDDMDDEKMVEEGVDHDLFRKKQQARAYQIIAHSRLSLTYSVMAQLEELESGANTMRLRRQAFDHAKRGVKLTEKQTDSSVVALAHFYYGRALLANGDTKKAFQHLNGYRGHGYCTPAIALCKHPSPEHRGHLRELVRRGVDLSFRDEDGYNAMDHAVYIGDTETESILVEGLKSKSVGDKHEFTADSWLRRGYRKLFQEKLRPVLLRGSPYAPDSLFKLRRAYAKALKADVHTKRMFDQLKYIAYSDFINLGRLRTSRDRLVRAYKTCNDNGKYIIFFSYRWIGEDHEGGRLPDDVHNTQYKRMINAVELFLKKHQNVGRENLRIWVVSLLPFTDTPSIRMTRGAKTTGKEQRVDSSHFEV